MHLRGRLASLACILQLLCLAPCAGSILTQGIRERPPPQQRTVRRTNGVVAERSNALDPPMPPQAKPLAPSQLQLKYYDVVQVDVVQRAGDDRETPLLTSGAGEGKSPPVPATATATATATKPPDAAKTLADQVAEGKYGLIHRELFQQRPQRFGVLSYRRNEEVPLDDERNYGGLQPDEIWLAEDHLLVLKGGSINFNNGNRSSSSASSAASSWKPIDDYRAPDRQVQIPLNPPVPPPFPVQLRENGPIEFIRGHQAAAFNPFTNESAFLFSNKAFPVIRPEDFGGQNLLARPAALNHTGQHNGLQYPAPVNPPPVSDNRTYSNPFLKLPPIVGPPPQHQQQQNVTAGPGITTVARDEDDDPSLYYPPPYSFEYRSNYTNPVPPGPLVPGIILPPPPNFFILKPTEPGVNGEQQQQQLKKKGANEQQQQGEEEKEQKEAKTGTNTVKYTGDRVKGAVSPVEIQKAVLVKSFVPMLELYGTGGGTVAPHRSKPSANKPRLRGKPNVPLSLSRPAPVAPTATTSLAPATTPTNVPVSTKLHKIALGQQQQQQQEVVVVRPELAAPVAPTTGKQAPHPIYAEYFNIKPASTPASWGDTSFTTTPSRTYLPSRGQEHEHQQQQQQPHHHHQGELVRTYGYSPIEQFHREVNTIRQTLQIYEKANKLAKAARTSKAHHQRPHPAAAAAAAAAAATGGQPGGRNRSGLSYGPGDQLYHAFFHSDVVVPGTGGPIVASYKAYAASGDEAGGGPVDYGGYYEPVRLPGPAAYQVYKPTAVQELPHGYIVTTAGEGAVGPTSDGFPRPYHNHQPPQYYQPRHRHQQLADVNNNNNNYHGQQQPEQLQQQQPQQLSYIAPVILNNGASGYNRLPEHHGGTTTKSYLILDHRTVTERLRQHQHQHQHQQPYLRYRHRGTAGEVTGYEHQEQEQLPAGNRYLEGDILVNYKHPLPPLNPDSEYLPYQPQHHHRLQIRKRQNANTAAPFFSSATQQQQQQQQQAIYSQSGR
ncbi:la-related protein Larp4B [Anopheles aquasalis]|uniref:la-related protein Larp4B n=1 Tax=Anopheles aquasalis TaxID=42839 RepID=UPI00215B243A|nr:la-related protein Larp4B [Anopheles aquasalis]XP_050092543.1 la-related protein Larp4B [Anopheles aquasalis]